MLKESYQLRIIAFCTAEDILLNRYLFIGIFIKSFFRSLVKVVFSFDTLIRNCITTSPSLNTCMYLDFIAAFCHVTNLHKMPVINNRPADKTTGNICLPMIYPPL